MAVFIKNFPPSIGNAVTSGGQHYMMINSYKQVNAVTTGETILSSIGLYIPPAALTTKFTGDYESKDGAATTAKMTEAAFVSAGKALLEKATQAVIATVDKGGFMSAQGKAPNNHVALLYKGPGSFRDHTFAFKFFESISSPGPGATSTEYLFL